MRARDIDYRCDEANLRGYLAMGENAAGPRPGVLVFHEGLGLGEFAMERARRLAGLGYVALAADMFGDRRQASNLQEVADAHRRGEGLAGHRLRQHAAWVYQPGRRWLDDAYRLVQRTGRPPLLGVDEKPV